MTNMRWLLGSMLLSVAAIAAVGCNQSANGITPRTAVEEPEQKSSAAKATPKAPPAMALTAPAVSAMLDDRFKVPDGSADVLLEFINRLANPEPFKSQAEGQTYQRNAASAIGTAAERILAGDVTEAQAGDAVEWKLESLRIAGRYGDATATAAADKFLETQARDKRVEVRRAASRMHVQRELVKAKSLDAAARLAPLEKYVADVKTNGLTLVDARLLAAIGDLCSKELFVTSAAAAGPFRELLPLFREHSDPKIAERAKYMEALVRRLEMPGRKFTLAGTTTDGKPLDWDAYHGKVVLVDFWATDCEECILETPNVARRYGMFRDKGFEVVGVNLNRDLAEVKKAMEQNGMVWPTLFQEHSDDERWSHPIADELAIDGLPQMILLDKEGTVVHMNVRGGALGDELRKLLGEPAVSAEEGAAAEIPDGSAADILKFVDSQVKSMTLPRNKDEERQNQERIRTLFTAAVEKILAGEPTASQAAEAIQMKIFTLRLSELAPQEGDQELLRFLKRLESSERPAIAAAAAEIQLLRAVEEWDMIPAADRTAFVERYAALAKEWGATTDHVALLEKLASIVPITGEEHLAARAVAEILPLYTDRSDPRIAQAAGILEGIQRRLNLPGTMLELQGTFMDGRPFDWNSYRGKVVLVDFWASWCGPCRAEIPNIKRHLDAYGDKGFTVLGVCLDDDRAAAQAYIDEAKVSWPSLVGSKPEESGFDHPTAKKYGITGVPLAILVDQQGKVVSLFARGPLLGPKLRDLLGEPTKPIELNE